MADSTCEPENKAAIDQSAFWSEGELNWTKQHCRCVTNFKLQKQIIRILFMPIIYAIISFFSYRFFRYYEYYEIMVRVWEAVVLSSFLVLVLGYTGRDLAEQAIYLEKEHSGKYKLPFPFNWKRFRPTKPKFLMALRLSCAQFVVLKPLLAAAAIATEYHHVYCASNMTVKSAALWITCIDFASCSIALYGLLVYYTLCKEDLKGYGLLSKFLSIKVVVFLTFFQSFAFDHLASKGILKESEYWTSSNVSNGLNALTICMEMALVAVWHLFCFSAKPYQIQENQDGLDEDNEELPEGKQIEAGGWKTLLQALNLGDVIYDFCRSMAFFVAKRVPTKLASIRSNSEDSRSDSAVSGFNGEKDQAKSEYS